MKPQPCRCDAVSLGPVSSAQRRSLGHPRPTTCQMALHEHVPMKYCLLQLLLWLLALHLFPHMEELNNCLSRGRINEWLGQHWVDLKWRELTPCRNSRVASAGPGSCMRCPRWQAVGAHGLTEQARMWLWLCTHSPGGPDSWDKKGRTCWGQALLPISGHWGLAWQP